MRRMEHIYDTPEGQWDREMGESTYYFYLTCAYYREATRFLENRFEDPGVASFLEDLPPEGRAQLEKVKASFTPWDALLQVKDVLLPVRNVVFHYTPRLPQQLHRPQQHRDGTGRDDAVHICVMACQAAFPRPLRRLSRRPGS